MRKTKTYKNTKFGTDVVREAFRVFTKQLPEDSAVASEVLNIKPDVTEGWRYDTDEEFLQLIASHAFMFSFTKPTRQK